MKQGDRGGGGPLLIVAFLFPWFFPRWGFPEGGAVFLQPRFSLIEGFNPDIELTRTQTIMQGASHCDFRFKLKKPAAG